MHRRKRRIGIVRDAVGQHWPISGAAAVPAENAPDDFLIFR
jgi:hypothetical protein